MRAMLLRSAGGGPLEPAELPLPDPGPGQVLVRVAACGVCRTDLHVVDGDLPRPKLPLVPGHEIVGRIQALGSGVSGLAIGQRVGVAWLGWTCGRCEFCASGRENLCRQARFTGYDLDGGYAEFASANARHVFPLPESFGDAAAAPLLCAGLIGYRAYRMALASGRPVERLGLYGFGAAAHIVAQLARHEGLAVYAFTRPGDAARQAFARSLGAAWAEGSDREPEVPLDAAILFAPVGALVPAALRVVAPGGVVVCAGIHMSDIPAFPYRMLWEERSIRSVANLTRRDGNELLELAARIPIRTSIRTYPLAEANRALEDLRNGSVDGAAVLLP